MSWRDCTRQNWPKEPSGRLVAPDALGGRQHRVAAVAFLVVAIVLVAVDDDLVADLPATDLAPTAQTMPDASEPATWNGALWTSKGEIGSPRPAQTPL
jgi:hypothetical protein